MFFAGFKTGWIDGLFEFLVGRDRPWCNSGYCYVNLTSTDLLLRENRNKILLPAGFKPGGLMAFLTKRSNSESKGTNCHLCLYVCPTITWIWLIRTRWKFAGKLISTQFKNSNVGHSHSYFTQLFERLWRCECRKFQFAAYYCRILGWTRPILIQIGLLLRKS